MARTPRFSGYRLSPSDSDCAVLDGDGQPLKGMSVIGRSADDFVANLEKEHQEAMETEDFAKAAAIATVKVNLLEATGKVAAAIFNRELEKELCRLGT
ncbi:MAG: hypothetical protein G01um101419_214, partial [Parcubacteria group bacterium Gr01-1014_19]